VKVFIDKYQVKMHPTPMAPGVKGCCGNQAIPALTQNDDGMDDVIYIIDCILTFTKA